MKIFDKFMSLSDSEKKRAIELLMEEQSKEVISLPCCIIRVRHDGKNGPTGISTHATITDVYDILLHRGYNRTISHQEICELVTRYKFTGVSEVTLITNDLSVPINILFLNGL